LNFNFSFKKEKNNMLINPMFEHFTHMNQILLNKINLLFMIPTMNKKYMGNIVCKHWKLSSIHEGDIVNMVGKYYTPLLSITNNERMLSELKKMNLERYKGLMQVIIHNQETRNLLYNYIFVNILSDYKNSKSSVIQQYLTLILELFAYEDRSLNFDNKGIEDFTKFSKKSETQIKTDYFKNLSLEDRKSENVLKEHKLEKWGVGLQKSMFTYVKGNYLKDKSNAQAVMDNMKIDDPDQVDIDDYVDIEEEVEGYDINERPEDDDDIEYEEDD
jgi:hypothetical protein